MVNGNYVLYGDRPSSESEIVDDHVQSRTTERRQKRKPNRTANELQPSLNLAQLDNETDSVKYEKKIKEPKLLRYVPTTDVEENFVTEKFETYDLQPATQERPRRHAFTKKPRNPSDSSVNYAYSRSSSSSPNGNLPTISEHGEQYGTYRVHGNQPSSKTSSDIMATESYASKLDKIYFTKPRESRKFSTKVNYNGSHPDSLYRVPVSSGAGAGNMARVLRALRWPIALVLVCTALAVFVYFLMPDNIESDVEMVNSTIWHASAGEALAHKDKARKQPPGNPDRARPDTSGKKKTKPMEIDFYEADIKENIDQILQSNDAVKPNRKLPIIPVFPDHIAPEVQYGNEKADADKARSAKTLDDNSNLTEDSTLKPHITQKPERPLAIYFKDVIGGLRPETITRAETVNDFDIYEKSIVESPRRNPSQYRVQEDERDDTSPEIQEYYPGVQQPNGNFTSGHSKFFGIGIEDVDAMKSTTQSSVYNTRVSPTLPTWRDGDDSTTKNYPLNLNTDVGQCRSPNLALCRGVLPYDLAGPPPTLGKMEITTLLPQIEYLVATNCSERTRLFMCSVLEPECNPPPYPPKMPCYNLCKAVSDQCESHIPDELAPVFNCRRYEKAGCLDARTPCTGREMTCDDGTCVPKEWICDGKKDCANGEDERQCTGCDKNQFRCRSGMCIAQRWVCDGYLDCADGDDEADQMCAKAGAGSFAARVAADEEPGEEPAGSAPAPSVRRPNKIHEGKRRTSKLDDSSKELLITSDSNNALKRNFTRRPYSRLTPYNKPKLAKQVVPEPEDSNEMATRKPSSKTTVKALDQSGEDINIGDLHFFDDIEKLSKDDNLKAGKLLMKPEQLHLPKNTLPPKDSTGALEEINRSKSKLSRVIDGDALLRKAAEELDTEKARLRNITEPEDYDRPKSSHTSPCPSGELRCVDGRCITLAQLCDGTIDCSDHADEDNCYT